jgi:hypothetical protein
MKFPQKWMIWGYHHFRKPPKMIGYAGIDGENTTNINQQYGDVAYTPSVI